MVETAYRKCSKCGAELPVDSASVEGQEDESILFVRYDPVHTRIVLINTESGVRSTVDLAENQASKPAPRQIGGIIGPY
jgi:hypothetical protein